MKRYAMTLVLAGVGLLVVGVAPALLCAQGREGFTDFRGRPYTGQELEKALFPEAPSDTRMRGIAPQQPQKPPSPSIGLNVFFEFNSDKILPQYYDDLNKLGEILARRSDYHFRIEGHTDSVGSDLYNQHLSERRAQSVKQYLVQHFSLGADHLEVIGFGENQPRFSNDTVDGRGQNRRVEFVNLGK